MRKIGFLIAFLAVVSPALFAVTGPLTAKVAFTSNRDGNNEIYAMTADGSSETRLTNNPANDTHPAVSRTGRIAFASDRDGNNEIYVMNANGSGQTRLTDHPGSDSQPTWSPDGTRIVFQSTRSGSFDIFMMNADGTEVTQLTDDPGFDNDPAFSPAGDRIVFVSTRDGSQEIYSMDGDGSNPTRLTNDTLFDSRPDFSPDGTRIVYASNVPDNGGQSQQVVLMNADGSGRSVLTSAGANGSPTFSADGKRIFFHSTRDLNSEIYSMDLSGGTPVRLTNNPASDTTPAIQSLTRAETLGVYRPSSGVWLLRNRTVFEGGHPLVEAQITFGGQSGDLPVAGNWNGDSRTDIGFFRNGVFHLAVIGGSSSAPTATVLNPISFGAAGDLPVAGDWDGDGKDEVGVFRPGTGKFHLRPNTLPGYVTSNITFSFGTIGDFPVAGDWDGDGIATVGVFRPGATAFDSGEFQLANAHSSSVTFRITLGGFDSLPAAGDWLGAGHDGVGVFIPASSTFVLTQELISKGGFTVDFGQTGDLPVAGIFKP
jgi:Tol biopolymer transport system component